MNLRLAVAFSIMLLIPVISFADKIKHLSQPGYTLLLRHALAPGVGDPAGFQLNDCQTQRNLSEQGRQQAVQIGDALRAAGIKKATVFSSRWCRCLQTAELLGLGEPEALPAIDSFFQAKAADAEKQATRAFQQHLADMRHQAARIYVTHQVNLSALLGGFADSGTGYLVKIGEQGDVEIISEYPAE